MNSRIREKKVPKYKHHKECSKWLRQAENEKSDSPKKKDTHTKIIIRNRKKHTRKIQIGQG